MMMVIKNSRGFSIDSIMFRFESAPFAGEDQWLRFVQCINCFVELNTAFAPRSGRRPILDGTCTQFLTERDERCPYRTLPSLPRFSPIEM
eukprot:1207195-Amphidinium_carterae.1